MNDFNESDLRTTVELLEILRNYQIHKGFTGTDYRLAKVLGVTHKAITHLIKNGGIMSDETAMTLALELELPLSYVLLCVWHERAKTEGSKDAIKEIADKYLKVSVFIFSFSVIVNTFTLLHNFA